jgi:ABC-type glycerol-3-phosphate transport system substrate-binding protein
MRKFAFIVALALTATFALSACNNNQQSDQAAEPVKVSKPTNPNDIKAWQAYLSQVIRDNMKGIQNSPYVYFVPAGDDPDNTAARGRVQDTLNGVVAATVLPGNMIAAGGPDSAKTADVLVTAFKDAQPGSFKGVVVLFVGDSADKQRVQDAIAPSGADFRFAQM